MRHSTHNSLSPFVRNLLMEYEALLNIWASEGRLLEVDEGERRRDIEVWVKRAAGSKGEQALNDIFDRVICKSDHQ